MEPTDTKRPDVDIEEEIDLLVNSFSPLKASRGYFSYESSEGHIRVQGNVRNPQARRVLLDNIPHIHGVVDCDSVELYDDEMIRFSVGELLPPGVLASVHYGAVALTGSLPSGASADTILKAIEDLPGVRRVGARFEPAEEVKPSATPT